MRAAILSVILAAMVAAGCNDDLNGPSSWTAIPDTVLIYSASRPEYAGQRSTFDLVNGFIGPINATNTVGNFDFVLAERSGALVLLPSGIVENRRTRSGFAPGPLTPGFEELPEAPRDTALYVQTSPATLQVNQVYFLRSRNTTCTQINTGFYYAKVQILNIDAVRGTTRIRWVRNPFCGERALITTK